MKLLFPKRDIPIVAVVLLVVMSVFMASPVFAAKNVVSIKLPSDMMSYKPGKGVELANQYCVTCHAADYLYMQPVMNKQKWIAVVNKMKKVFGCPVENKDIDALASYLTAQNAKK
jgi:mono/diheme cytochrome c family protein